MIQVTTINEKRYSRHTVRHHEGQFTLRYRQNSEVHTTLCFIVRYVTLIAREEY